MGFREKLLAGERVFLAELAPPKGSDTTVFVSNALGVKGRADAVLVLDMPGAVMRMSALGGAAVLAAQGLSCVMQMTCRDRNRLALQADLLAAWALGVRAVHAVKGEDPRLGDHPDARAVYGLDSTGLIGTARSLGEGRDMAGGALSGSPDFLMGASVLAAARGSALMMEIEDMERKIEAGARFFVTQPVLDAESLTAFRKRVDPAAARVLPRVIALRSAAMARWVAAHVDHVNVPPALAARLEEAEFPVTEGMRAARETLEAVLDMGFPGAVLGAPGIEHRLCEWIPE
jgi:5,10-methylenetetrahydrofolate reductase